MLLTLGQPVLDLVANLGKRDHKARHLYMIRRPCSPMPAGPVSPRGRTTKLRCASYFRGPDGDGVAGRTPYPPELAGQLLAEQLGRSVRRPRKRS